MAGAMQTARWTVSIEGYATTITIAPGTYQLQQMIAQLRADILRAARDGR